jgi:hypothetical protein
MWIIEEAFVSVCEIFNEYNILESFCIVVQYATVDYNLQMYSKGQLY